MDYEFILKYSRLKSKFVINFEPNLVKSRSKAQVGSKILDQGIIPLITKILYDFLEVDYIEANYCL